MSDLSTRDTDTEILKSESSFYLGENGPSISSKELPPETNQDKPSTRVETRSATSVTLTHKTGRTRSRGSGFLSFPY